MWNLKTIKHLEENVGENLNVLGLGRLCTYDTKNLIHKIF